MSKKLIILAAGMGQRLQPLTAEIPKCMLPLAGRNLLEWQILSAQKVGVNEKDIVIVAGHKAETIPGGKWTIAINPRYAQTNMLRTLWYAEKFFDSGIVVSYGDIVYEPEVLEKVVSCRHEIGVVVDHDWRSYWEKRFESVLDDAESLKLDSDGRILEIGQKPDKVENIQGQYIGLMVFQGNGLSVLRRKYSEEATLLSSHEGGEKMRIDTLYMTDMLQELIDEDMPVYEIPINGKWVEIDSLRDLRLAESFCRAVGDSLSIDRRQCI